MDRIAPAAAFGSSKQTSLPELQFFQTEQFRNTVRMSAPVIIKSNESTSRNSPTVVGSYRNKIQALQKWTKSLLYKKPIQGYTRLATALHNRLTRREVDKEDNAQRKRIDPPNSL